MTSLIATPTIKLAPSSDSGVVGDGITNVTEPTITGTAVPGANVQVRIDGTLVGTALVSAKGLWSFTPSTPLSSAKHTITATAVNASGATSAPSSLVLVIDTVSPAPSIGLTAATDSGVIGDDITKFTKPTFTGVAAAGATVKLLVDGKSAGTVVANAAGLWSFTPTAALAAGDHIVTATAVDVAGNTSLATSMPLLVEATVWTVLSTGSKNTTIVGTGSDIVNVTWGNFSWFSLQRQPNGSVLITDNHATGHSILVSNAATIQFTNEVYNVATGAPSAWAPPKAPTVQLAPASDSGVLGDDITNVVDPTFTGSAEANSMVSITIDGQIAGSTLANAAGVWSYTPASNLANGPHTVNATAVDVEGYTTNSANVALTIDTSSPAAPTIGLAASSGTNTDTDTTSLTKPTFTGMAEAGATVNVQIDGSLVGDAIANAAGAWSYTPTAALAIGAHIVTATEVDIAGNISSASTIPLTIIPSTPILTAGTITNAPSIPQPTAAGDIVGLVLQNNQSSVLAAREITFGQEFAAGQVMPGTQLVADINGTLVPVQMDVKTTNPDGSVAMAVLTMQQPALAANSSVNVMLQSGTYAVTPAVSLSSLTSGSYNFTVGLTMHNADGSTTPFTINVAQALAAALSAGTVSYWLQGSQATEARIDVPISGSLHITFDITAYADGTTSTDVQFNNDLTMTTSGGVVTYDATISQNGVVVFAQSNITQYQYQTWDQQIWSNGAPQVNVQHDIAALEATGDIQNYDLSTGVAASVINQEATAMTGPGFGVLGNAGITEYMPETGARADIGTTTQANAAWLITQNQTAEEYALAQADAAGSVPWHFFDPTTGSYINVANYPTLWTDSSAVHLGATALTQLMPTYAQTGWYPDSAHEPDLNYIGYLMTGNRYYLDQLNAEAAYDVISTAPNGRQDGQGIVADGTDQVRAQAWNLREIVEAASANPVGSAEGTYFTNIMNANFTFLLNETTSANQGQASGWIPGNANGSGEIAPWQQDYFATTVVLAAEQGVAAATQLLLWETNFLAGRFLSAAEGMDPHLGIAYRLNTYVPGASETNAYQTWAQIENVTLATGDASNVSADGSSWTNADGNYASLARASLAGDITVTGSPEAMDAYGWITAYAPQAGTAYQQLNPAFDIAPRLPDGQLLTANNIIVSDDTIAANLYGSNADQMIYETGPGNVTIAGGTGINLLFAGSGNDTLIGGPNNDYLFGGSGPDIMSAGAGTNYIQPGTGAATVLLAGTDSAQDLIADFKVGIDHLAVTDPASNPATAAEISALIAGTTVNTSGGAVIHLFGAHDVTLQGISVGQVTTALFS